MIHFIRSTLGRLPFRMVAPVVLVIGLVGAGLYVSVLRSVSDFADYQLREALNDVARKVYGICDENFTELIQSGKMSDPKEVLIKKAVTMGAIEEYAVRNGVACRLLDEKENVLMNVNTEPDVLDAIVRHHRGGRTIQLKDQQPVRYFNHFEFKPWGWHVDLIKQMDEYAPLISRVKTAYIVTGALLLVAIFLILNLQQKFLQRPLNSIIQAIQRKEPPRYKGVFEFEFLSAKISAMMKSLEEKNQWIERLYRIAITNRGEDFYGRVANLLSEMLEANVLVVDIPSAHENYRPIAFSLLPSETETFENPSSGLPLGRVVAERKPVIISSGAAARFPSAPVLSKTGAQSYAGIPVLDREGGVIGVISVFGKAPALDEWSRNLIETVARMVAVELEFSAKERDRMRLENQLQKARKMEAIGTLAGGVAHDLNNILSGIVGYPDLILMDLPEKSPLREAILAIKKSGERAAVIVQDLLTLARRGVAISKVVNLNPIIQDQLKSPEFESLQAHYPKMEVKTRLESDLLNIKGSTTHLAKSIMNIIANAFEAMPEGGEIHIATENRYIDYPIKGYDHVEEGDYAVLTISDSGTGIPSADMERIFEPFYTKKAMGRSGSGLGMAVVWGTVKDHNGYIDLISSEGKGTTFVLYFPVCRDVASAQTTDNVPGEYNGNGETILVVDDLATQRDLASAMLGKLGYRVATAASGEEAVAYMESHTVDLLVLDMIMGDGIDGLETYRRIVDRHPGQKAIIASGFSETERVRAAQRLGAGQYIKKPYTLEKIGMAVQTELPRR